MAENELNAEDYALLDSGGGRVLERMGNVVTSRPCPAVWWRRKLPGSEWRKAVDLKREPQAPPRLKIGGVRFQMPRGGSVRALAPELLTHWERAGELCAAFAEKNRLPARVLHLFGGAGGVTLAAAQAGASVTHVDVSAEAIQRVRESAAINTLANRDIRWVVDDPVKFAQRERAQTARHDLIVLDPFVPKDAKRGSFELERDLGPLLGTVSGLLSDKSIGVMLFCRQGGVSPTTLHNLTRQEFSVFGGGVESGELLLRGTEEMAPVPCGAFALWLSKRDKA